ncbi:aspartate aminotransferase family protein [Nocardioides korecus]
MTTTQTDDLTVTDDDLARGRRAHELDRQHVFHSWQAQRLFDPMTIVAAEGSRVVDGEGRTLLDFSSQLVFTNVGHQHPRVVEAIRAQAATLCTVAPQHVNEARSEAARLIAEITPGDLDRVFFTNGGADAVEHAIRMARLHTGRKKVLASYRSYHGGTHLAINTTGDPRRIANDDGDAGVVHFFTPYLYRSHFHAETPEQECERALQHLADVIVLEGATNIAAVVLESIPGTAGIMVPPAGYLAGVRRLCDQHGIMLVTDEVMSGFGRSGAWFGIEHATHDGTAVVPDLLTFAKGVNSGYVPLGGVAISPAVAETFAERAYPGGLTYSGHPLACAAAVATIGAMREERMVENAERLGREVFGPGLEEIAERHRSVGEVRGVGAFWAVELVADPETREPLAPNGGSSPAMAATVGALKAGGVLPFANSNRIHLVPPLNVSDADARRGLEVLDEALEVTDRHTR